MSELIAGKSGARHRPRPATLREPNYRFFAGGWLFASVGLQIQGTALAWEIYELTHDPFMLGIAGLARVLPVCIRTFRRTDRRPGQPQVCAGLAPRSLSRGEQAYR